MLDSNLGSEEDLWEGKYPWAFINIRFIALGSLAIKKKVPLFADQSCGNYLINQFFILIRIWLNENTETGTNGTFPRLNRKDPKWKCVMAYRTSPSWRFRQCFVSALMLLHDKTRINVITSCLALFSSVMPTIFERVPKTARKRSHLRDSADKILVKACGQFLKGRDKKSKRRNISGL